MKDGTVSAISPQPNPIRRAPTVPSAMKKEIPVPTVVKSTEAMMIVRVDGKATRRMKL